MPGKTIIGRSIRNFLTIQFTLFLLLFSFTGNSQGLYVSVFGMFQRTYLNNRYENEQTKLAKLDMYGGARYFYKKPSYTFGSGFLLKNAIHKRFLICYGLNYSGHAQSYEIGHEVGNTEIIKGRIRLSYMRLPVLLQYNYLIGKNYFLYASGGIGLAALLYETGAFPVYDKALRYIDLYDSGGIYKNFNLETQLGIGGEYRMSSQVNFFLQGRAESSVNNVEKESYIQFINLDHFDIYSKEDISRSPTYAIACGVLFGLTIKVR